MARECAGVRGRSQELAALRAALTGDGGRLVVLRGPTGIGRTALLDAVARGLAAEGLRVVHFGVEDDGEDRYGIGRMLRVVREGFERFGDPGLADSVNTVAGLRDIADGDLDAWVPMAITELGGMFDRIRRSRRTALVVDDVHTIAEPALLLDSARRSGCLVLAGCQDDREPTAGMGELLTVADAVITLGPLADEHVVALVARSAGAPLDEAVPSALRAALGPLFGNPATVLSTVADLRAGGRLVLVRDRLCLAGPDMPVALPADHHLPRRARELGPLGTRLLAAVAVIGELGVDDLPLLADALGAEPTDCGRVLDRLIAAGVLVTDQAGRVDCRCAALAAHAISHVGDAERDRLRAAVANSLLARWTEGAAIEPAVLADRIAHAGLAVTLDEEILCWLRAQAVAAEWARPDRAARWYAAVLRRSNQDDPEHAMLLAALLDLVVRTGQYELLHEVLDRSGGSADLRTAAVLVTMHTSAPPADPAVRALLDGDPTGFADRWFGHPVHSGGRQLLSAGQADLLHAALSGDPRACALSWRRSGRPPGSPLLEELRSAASVFDMATVFAIVLGDRYRIPEHGILGAYRRVVRGYASGEWHQAMSAVRELELSGSGARSCTMRVGCSRWTSVALGASLPRPTSGWRTPHRRRH